MNWFEEDVKAAYEAFWENNLPANKGEAADMFKDGIDSAALTKTIEESEWNKATSIKAEDLIERYDIEGEEYDEETSVLSLKEFVYMNIFENIAVSSENEC